MMEKAKKLLATICLGAVALTSMPAVSFAETAVEPIKYQEVMPRMQYNVPGAINFCKSILPKSLDTCEGGRYSCYIGADMIMVPCSFDQEKRYEVSLREMSIIEAWNSDSFENFRNKMRGACPDCEKKELCMGGCPLMPEIVFCKSKKRKIL